MTDRIEPALTAEQWADWRRDVDRAGGIVGDTIYSDTVGRHAAECAEIIAYNNDALPDDDKRKITREWVTHLRWAVEDIGGFASTHPSSDRATRRTQLIAFLDEHMRALASYLPPE